MSTTDYYEIKKELVWLLRNNITDPKTRGSDTTETFSGNDSDTDFELSQAGAVNVSSVTVGGSPQSYGTDYTITENRNTKKYTISFNSPPATGSNNISITYHYGGTWIYPDLPEVTLKVGSYPRIGIADVSGTQTEVSLNASTTRTSMLKDIKVFSLNNKELTDIVNDIKDTVISNKKSLYYVNLIIPAGLGPVMSEQDRSEHAKHKVISQNLTVEMPFIYES